MFLEPGVRCRERALMIEVRQKGGNNKQASASGHWLPNMG